MIYEQILIRIFSFFFKIKTKTSKQRITSLDFYEFTKLIKKKRRSEINIKEKNNFPG
jgi:hypothetical protein